MITTPIPISLRPKIKHPVRKLVKLVGISVDDWAFTKDGEVIENPNNNIGRNTNWSFVGKDGEPIVLCVWYDSIAWNASPVQFAGNEH